MEDDAEGRDGRGDTRLLSDADFTDSFGEASAISKYLAEQRSSGASELIREVAAIRGRGGFGLTDSRAEVEGDACGAPVGQGDARGEGPGRRRPVPRPRAGCGRAAATAKSGLEAAETEAIEKIREALR